MLSAFMKNPDGVFSKYTSKGRVTTKDPFEEHPYKKRHRKKMYNNFFNIKFSMLKVMEEIIAQLLLKFLYYKFSVVVST